MNMRNWEDRSPIVANLLNPAFCGEILRRAIDAYNANNRGLKFPYSLFPLILPMVLNKNIRDIMPNRTTIFFYKWVNENEFVFLDFANSVKNLMPYSNEALMFLLLYKSICITEDGNIEVFSYKKKSFSGENMKELNDIYKKVKILGNMFRVAKNEQTIYSFLKIRP